MTDTWESRYEKAINNKYRNFNIGGDANYRICNLYCNFEITNLDKKEYIKGITATGSSNLLHLNPLVNTKPPQKGLQAVGIHTGKTIEREKNIHIDYRFKGKGGLSDRYKLIDIFIRTPSKVVLSGKRYQMEVCMVFISEDESRYLVTCVPIKISPNNTTEDPLQKDLFELLIAITDDFPTKGKTYSIQKAPNWNPLIFFPIKTGTNASFYTWVDPTTNDSVMYVQYVNPITAPYKFYETFANTLSGSLNTANQAVTLPPQKEHADLEIYFNKNQAAEDITTTYRCETKTNPILKEMVDFQSPTHELPPSKENPKEKRSYTWVYVTLFVFLIILLAWTWYNTEKLREVTQKFKNKLKTVSLPPIPPSEDSFNSSVSHPAVL